MQRLNCLPCRRRKSKCDRAEPCLSCVLRGTEAYCYTDLEPPAPQPRAAPAAAASASAGPSTFNNGNAAEGSSARASADDDHRPTKVRHLSGTNGAGGSFGASRAQAQQQQHRSAGQGFAHSYDHALGLAAPTRDSPDFGPSQSSIHKTLDSIENSLREVRRTVQTESQQRTLSSWGTIVPWSDARKLFPEPDEASAIFHCFFTELRWYMSSVDQEEFETMWARAEKGKEDLPRHRVALICAVMAFSLLLAPRAHPASRLPQKTTTDARWHIDNARCLIDAHYQSSTHAEEEVQDSSWKDLGSQDEMIGQLEAETVYCYYCAVSGLIRKSFFALGRAVRLGLGTHLFEEARWKVQAGADVERRRCIAWDLITMDRWTAGHLGIQSSFPTQPRVKCSNKESGRATLDRNRMTDYVAKIVNYTNAVTSMPMHTRVEQCETLGQEIAQFYNEMPQDMQFHRLTNTTSFDPNIARRASQALSMYLATLFLQAMRVRPFLMDAAAPPHLRFASLQYARKIIELRPQLIAMTHNPWTSHPPSWSLQFIFIASTMFASVLLSRESASTESPGDARGATVIAAHADPSFWPNADLDWFSDVIYDVSETFDLLAQGAKTNTARTCKRLFAGLCSSRETLRKRFQERERERLQQARGLRSEERLNRSESSKSGKRPPSFHAGPTNEEGSLGQQHRDGNAALVLSDPFKMHIQGKGAGESAEAIEGAAPPFAANTLGLPPTGVVISGLPNLYNLPTSGQSTRQSTGYGNQSLTPKGAALPLYPYGDASGLPKQGTTPNFAGHQPENLASSSDFSTPPDFANSALDMIYLDPLEWAQLTAGLDTNVDM